MPDKPTISTLLTDDQVDPTPGELSYLQRKSAQFIIDAEQSGMTLEDAIAEAEAILAAVKMSTRGYPH